METQVARRFRIVEFSPAMPRSRAALNALKPRCSGTPEPSSRAYTDTLPPSDLSPTLCSLLLDLQQLEGIAPLTVAAIHRYVVGQLVAVGDEPIPNLSS